MTHVAEPPPSGERFGDLMRRAQQGEGIAYRDLLEEISPRIRALVRRRRGFVGPEHVEDLVQEVLLSVHTVRATYDPGRPFMPWLLAIVRIGWSMTHGGTPGRGPTSLRRTMRT